MMIRQIKQTDLAQVCAIEAEIFTDAWTRQSFEETMQNPESYLLVASGDNDTVLGYCCLYVAADEGEIVNVAVCQQARKQGIGYALVNALMNEGKAHGVTFFYLEVRQSNLPAQKLYEKLGFTVAGQRKNFYQKPQEHALIMTCEVDA